MDIEIDVECRHCGHEFTQSFGMMRHGKALRCPFCASFSLELTFDRPVETPAEIEAFERQGARLEERKAKA